MKIDGKYDFGVDRETVWNALQDPQILASTLPGVKRLEILEPDRYSITAHVGVGSVKGLYDGTFSVEDKCDFESCTLRGSARGTAGSMEVEVRARLTDGGGAGAVLEYDADARITGALAGVGQRMLSAAAKGMSREFLGAVERAVTADMGTSDWNSEAGAAEITTPILEPAAEGRGRVFTPQPVPADPHRRFLEGIALGFLLALAGVVLGRLTARRS